MNFIREYFIGDYLRSEPDVLRQASIRLVYNIVIVSLFAMVTFFFVYIVKGFHYQLIKNMVVAALFTGILFYLRATRSFLLVTYCECLSFR
jgi:hypothetical protein